MTTRELLDQLLDGMRLTETQLHAVFEQMLSGVLSEPEIAAFLAGWRIQGETALELTAGARSMRQRAILVPKLSVPKRPLADNCGTGGDGSHSFNISTASAIVAASAGLCVAKHGNRSVSSRCGSADLLFAAGFPAHLSPAAAGELLRLTGFSFFFAPNFHPSLQYVMPTRRTLGVRTIFNLLGPLANPLAPNVQLVGVGARKLLRPMAEALGQLGVTAALIVHARDGMDELSPTAICDAVYVVGGQLTELVIDPQVLQLKAKSEELVGGDAAHNLVLLQKLLAGEVSSISEAVALNAGALLWVAGVSNSLQSGLTLAREQLRSKAAQVYFDDWLSTARKLAV